MANKSISPKGEKTKLIIEFIFFFLGYIKSATYNLKRYSMVKISNETTSKTLNIFKWFVFKVDILSIAIAMTLRIIKLAMK